jgi:hypothetical protein
VVGPGEIIRVARFCRVGMCAADVSNLVLDFPLGLCHYVQTVRGKGHHLEAESSSRCRFLERSQLWQKVANTLKQWSL